MPRIFLTQVGWSRCCVSGRRNWARSTGSVPGCQRRRRRLGVPLAIHRVGGSGPVVDPTGPFAATYGLSPAGAVLVRRDGVRGGRPTPAARDEPHTLLTAILDRA